MKNRLPLDLGTVSTRNGNFLTLIADVPFSANMGVVGTASGWSGSQVSALLSLSGRSTNPEALYRTYDIMPGRSDSLRIEDINCGEYKLS